jgi:NADH:ubiquinone oxidoreductase subunit 6 (subunit J)
MEPINWHSFFFLLFALVTCAFAVGVAVASNIVRMAFYLIISLGATAGLFFLAGADFVAAMQLLIYVGGTLVLLVFGVMLTAQGPFISMKTDAGGWALAGIVGGSMLFLLVATAFRIEDWRAPEVTVSAAEPALRQAALDEDADPVSARPVLPEHVDTATPLGLGLLGARVDQETQENDALRGGMSGYLLPFEIVSVHLLVVLIGAAYLARARRLRTMAD